MLLGCVLPIVQTTISTRLASEGAVWEKEDADGYYRGSSYVTTSLMQRVDTTGFTQYFLKNVLTAFPVRFLLTEEVSGGPVCQYSNSHQSGIEPFVDVLFGNSIVSPIR